MNRVLLLLSDQRWAMGIHRRWQAVAPKMEVCVIPGDHFTFITEHVTELGDQLRASLQNARRA